MIHVPERIGIIGGSGIYDINKGVKPQYCSFKKNSVRPELVEGFLVNRRWFDQLTTNG